jgi:hypothetical protein
MERLVDDVRRFKTQTLFAASGAIFAHAQRLSDEIRQVVVNARLILTYLKDPVRELSVALDRVTRLKEKVSFLIFPRAELELETRSIFVLHGSRALKVEIDELEARAEELEIDLQGNVFERLLENEDIALGDKDGD